MHVHALIQFSENTRNAHGDIWNRIIVRNMCTRRKSSTKTFCLFWLITSSIFDMCIFSIFDPPEVVALLTRNSHLRTPQTCPPAKYSHFRIFHIKMKWNKKLSRAFCAISLATCICYSCAFLSISSMCEKEIENKLKRDVMIRMFKWNGAIKIVYRTMYTICSMCFSIIAMICFFSNCLKSPFLHLLSLLLLLLMFQCIIML